MQKDCYFLWQKCNTANLVLLQVRFRWWMIDLFASSRPCKQIARSLSSETSRELVSKSLKISWSIGSSWNLSSIYYDWRRIIKQEQSVQLLCSMVQPNATSFPSGKILSISRNCNLHYSMHATNQNQNLVKFTKIALKSIFFLSWYFFCIQLQYPSFPKKIHLKLQSCMHINILSSMQLKISKNLHSMNTDNIVINNRIQ